MAYHNFIPYSTKEILVKFKCKNCGTEIEEIIPVPWPDIEGDSVGAEDTIENDDIQCPDCERNYGYSIVSYGDLELEDIDEDQVDFFDFFYEPPELDLLKKWNNRLLLKEPSKKFCELVLEIDPSKDSGTIRREWFNEILQLKDSFFKEDPYKNGIYTIQTMTGRELLIYHIKKSDSNEFENDMKSAWDFLESCYDKEWWIKAYGDFSDGHPANSLILEKRRLIIGAHWQKK
jgi:DNA-directed RNA polymerase subunit RPC12/RpoP